MVALHLRFSLGGSNNPLGRSSISNSMISSLLNSSFHDLSLMGHSRTTPILGRHRHLPRVRHVASTRFRLRSLITKFTRIRAYDLKLGATQSKVPSFDSLGTLRLTFPYRYPEIDPGAPVWWAYHLLLLHSGVHWKKLKMIVFMDFLSLPWCHKLYVSSYQFELPMRMRLQVRWRRWSRGSPVVPQLRFQWGGKLHLSRTIVCYYNRYMLHHVISSYL